MLQIFVVIILSILFSCQNPAESECLDIDIRSAGKFSKAKGKPCFTSIRKDSQGVRVLLAHNAVSDSIFNYEVNETMFFFFKEKNTEGVTGSDNFIFTKNSFVYKVRISNEISPDNQHYVSVFKYVDSICINYEGKAIYDEKAGITRINKFDASNLLHTLSDIDSSVFKRNKPDFRLSSYL